MALIDKQDERNKKSSKESFIAKFKTFTSYVIATMLHYSHVYHIK